MQPLHFLLISAQRVELEKGPKLAAWEWRQRWAWGRRRGAHSALPDRGSREAVPPSGTPLSQALLTLSQLTDG